MNVFPPPWLNLHVCVCMCVWTLQFSKKECSSESVTGHQLDSGAAIKVPTLSTPSVLAISIRVLIVEDHLANRILLEAMLNKRSNQDVCYEIETAKNGLEAVQIASSRRYNIILMDCNMPIMDGWQVWISERNRNTRNWKTAVAFMLVLCNYMYLQKNRKNISGCKHSNSGGNVCIFWMHLSLCITFSHVCSYPRTNVLCQHPKTFVRVNKDVVCKHM